MNEANRLEDITGQPLSDVTIDGFRYGSTFGEEILKDLREMEDGFVRNRMTMSAETICAARLWILSLVTRLQPQLKAI